MRSMRPFLLAFAVLLAAALPARAQTIDSYTLRTYNVGAPAPLQSFTFQAAAAQCNQTPPPVNPTNPAQAIWNDGANPTKVCIWLDPGNGILMSTPFGSYEGTLTATNQGGSSPESARAPFTRSAVPPVQTGFRFAR